MNELAYWQIFHKKSQGDDPSRVAILQRIACYIIQKWRILESVEQISPDTILQFYQDVLAIGDLIGKNFVVDVYFLKFQISVQEIIASALKLQSIQLFQLINQRSEIKIADYCPNIIAQAVQNSNAEIVEFLIKSGESIAVNNYEALWLMASKNMVPMLDLALDKLKTDAVIDLPRIVHRLCAQAINDNCQDVVYHLLPAEYFTQIPDLIREYVLCSIKCRTDNLSLIKYFVTANPRVPFDFNGRVRDLCQLYQRQDVLDFLTQI